MTSIGDAVRRFAPAKIDDLWAKKTSSSEEEQFSHFLAQHLFEWADDEAIEELLKDEERLQSLVVEVADAALQLGFNAQQINPPGALIGSCFGCNTPYDNGGCDHGDSKIRIPMSELGPQNAAIVSQNLHNATKLFALTAHLLSKTNSYKLAELMTPEPPPKCSPETFISNLAMSGTRGFCCVLQLFALLDNASVAFPKAAMYATACLSLAVSRRPAQAFALLDAESMAKALQKYGASIFDLIHNSECIVEECYGIAAFLNLLPLLYNFGDWRNAHRPIRECKLVQTVFTFSANILHSIHKSKQRDDDRVDVQFDEETFPELEAALIFIDPRMKSKILTRHPMSFAVVASLEILTRWSFRGILILTEMLPTDDAGLEPIGDLMEECRHQLESLCPEAQPVGTQLIKDLLEGNKFEFESSRSDEFLLSNRMNKLAKWCNYCGERMSCAKVCSGGCLGLARYCCKDHQKAHWSRHKYFCKLQQQS